VHVHGALAGAGSCSSPPPALASRRFGALRCLRAPARLRKWGWQGTNASRALSRAGVQVRARRRAGPEERPGGHGAPARLPCTLKGASPAVLVLFAAARARAASKVVRNQCRARYPARRLLPPQRRAGGRAERALEATRERPRGHGASAGLLCPCEAGPARLHTCAARERRLGGGAGLARAGVASRTPCRAVSSPLGVPRRLRSARAVETRRPERPCRTPVHVRGGPGRRCSWSSPPARAGSNLPHDP